MNTMKNLAIVIWYLLGSFIIPCSFIKYAIYITGGSQAAYNLSFALPLGIFCMFFSFLLLHFSVLSFWSESKKAQTLGLFVSIFISLIPTGIAMMYRVNDLSIVTPVTLMMLAWIAPVIYGEVRSEKAQAASQKPKLKNTL